MVHFSFERQVYQHKPVADGGTRGGEPKSLKAYSGERRNLDFSPLLIVLTPIYHPGSNSSEKNKDQK